MATNFPTSLDSLTNPTSGSALNSPDHAGQHSDANDAIEALEAKVGVNGSAVSTSLDYKLTNGIMSSLNVDSGTLIVDPANNRVGVNTNSPASALDVVGSVTARTAAIQDGVALAGRAGGTGTYEVTLTPTTLSADRTVTLPNVSGTAITTGNTSDITSVGALSSLAVLGTSNVGTIDAVGTVSVRNSTNQDEVRIQGRAGGSSGFRTILTPTTLTATRTLTLPDKTGTVATTADLGLVYITSGTFSSSSAVSINNCFSSTYTNYRVVFGNITHSTTLVLRIRMRLSGTDSSSASWDYAWPYLYANGASISLNNGTGQTGLYVGDTNSTSNGVAAFSLDVFQPNVARRTAWLGNAINIYTNFFTMSGGGVHNVETAYDGFTLYTSTGTISGNYQVFGYTK